MIVAPLPKNEQERLRELTHLGVLDTPEESAFNNIAALAAQICQTPIAFVSLVDQHRQWFKACVGLAIRKLPRNQSLCSYTILSDELMEVRDMIRDERFRDLSITKPPLSLRYYAGAPLVTSSGYRLGALCVLDHKPHALTQAQKFALEVLAKETVQQLEFKSTNRHLRRSLSLAEEISQTGMFEFDLITRRLTFSPSLFRLFNLPNTSPTASVAEVVSVIEAGDLERMKQYIKQQLAHSNTLHFTYRTVHSPPAAPVHHECRGVILRDKRGHPYRLTGAIRDITKEKNREIMLEKQRKELKKVHLELDNLVYRVSHDLRAPIASALGLLYLSQQEEQLVAVQPLLKMAEETLHKQDRYISKILTYSMNSRSDIQRNEIDLKTLMTEQIEQNRPPHSPVEVLISVEQPVPLFSDEQRLTVVISNLLSNAFRYAKPARARPFVNVEAVVTEEETWLQITDNGIGISPKCIKHIFKMFYRATSHSNGSGIGLYIVQETVEKLSGTVTVRSQEGMGTTFEVSVPNMLQAIAHT